MTPRGSDSLLVEKREIIDVIESTKHGVAGLADRIDLHRGGAIVLDRADARWGKSPSRRVLKRRPSATIRRPARSWTRFRRRTNRLVAYSDQGQFVVAMTIGGKATKQATPMKLTFVRPNKVDLDAGHVRLTSDGKTLTTIVVPLKEVHDDPRAREISLDTFREGPDRGDPLRRAQPARRCPCC